MGNSAVIPMNKRKRVSVKDLTVGQQKFIQELVADDFFDATAAATKAGYKSPQAASQRLLKTPTVQAALGKAMRERQNRCELRADDIMEFIRNALFFNPLKYFIPTDDGSWAIDDPKSIPDAIGMLIESLEVQIVPLPDGTERKMFKVKMVSKTQILGHALKHMDAGKYDKGGADEGTGFDWDAAYQEFLNGPPSNVIDV